MTKKLICFILAFLMILSFAGCRKTEDNTKKETTANETTVTETTAEETTVADTTTAETTAAPATEAVIEPAATDAPTTEPPVPVITEDPPIAEQPVQSGTQYPKVLMYHLILDEPYTQYTGLFVKVADFEDHLVSLINAGYSFCFADEFGPVDKKTVCLTFDDGYVDNYTNMFPLLKKYNVKATVFMIGYSIDREGYLSRDQIIEMSESGLVQFGSHTLSHRSLSSLGEAEQFEELNGSRWILNELTGQPINSICYPAGDYNATTIKVGRENGYFFGYTTNPGTYTNEDLLEIPRFGVPRGMTGAGLLSRIGG